MDKMKYPGCFLVAAKSFKLSLHDTRLKFYKAFSPCIGYATNLVNMFCCSWFVLTVSRFSLMYEAVSPTKNELNSLEHTYRAENCTHRISVLNRSRRQHY